MMVRDSRAEDDAALRRIAAIPMPGAIETAYLHEPSFFQAEALKGFCIRPITGIDDRGNIFGCGTRSFKRIWLNGHETTIGYLGSLRLEPSHRGSHAFARGYALFKKQDAQEGGSLYFTTILAGNAPAIRLLAANRKTMPRYEPAGKITTFLATARALKRLPSGSNQAVNGEDVGADALFTFYRAYAKRRNLFPALTPDSLGTPEFAGLVLRDFTVILRRGEIVAAAACWDQRALRQIQITRYHPALRLIRPLINLPLILRGYPALPPEKSILPQCYLAFALTADDSPATFHALLHSVSQNLKTRYAAFALHENDPMLTALNCLTAWRYTSLLYFVNWNHSQRLQLNPKIPIHIELSGI